MKAVNEKTSVDRKPRVWSIELVLVVFLPLAAVVACSITLYLALKYPAHESAMLDRFGHEIAAQKPH
ncbi:hypothetical protein [Hydrocarboniphaga sp.]|uniref:hypothetical protein n=1 Tax=Hydrocarboniphaga sp. TaxID=2033016 RepID=UPI003D13B186